MPSQEVLLEISNSGGAEVVFILLQLFALSRKQEFGFDLILVCTIRPKGWDINNAVQAKVMAYCFRAG